MQESNAAVSAGANSNRQTRSSMRQADPPNEQVDAQFMEEQVDEQLMEEQVDEQLMLELTLAEQNDRLNKALDQLRLGATAEEIAAEDPTEVCYKLIFDKIFFIIIFILFLHLCRLN